MIEGNADVYFHTTAIKKWDICAGDAILRSLGGKMTDRNNLVLDYSAETNPKNEKGLIAALYKHAEYFDKLKDV